MRRAYQSVPRAPRGISTIALGSDGKSPIIDLLVREPHGPTTNRILATGSAWKYLVDGSDQGMNWIDPGFQDRAHLMGKSDPVKVAFDPVTWQPGPFLADGRRVLFLSMEAPLSGLRFPSQFPGGGLNRIV